MGSAEGVLEHLFLRLLVTVAEGDGGGWQRGTWMVNNREYARKTNGRVYKLRVWNSRTEQWDWKDAGKDYYRHNKQKFIINLKCLGYISPASLDADADFDNLAAEDVNEQGTEDDDPLLRSTWYGAFQSTMILPLTPESLVGDVPTALSEMANLGIVRDQDYSQGDIETALRAAVPELLRRLPRFNSGRPEAQGAD